MHVLFKHSGLKEGIYRGSMRLEHSVNTNKVLKNTDRAGETKAAEPSSVSHENPQEACPGSRSNPTTPPTPPAAMGELHSAPLQPRLPGTSLARQASGSVA
ncbi:unnamed protein product [Gadus morhua 'NCC']